MTSFNPSFNVNAAASLAKSSVPVGGFQGVTTRNSPPPDGRKGLVASIPRANPTVDIYLKKSPNVAGCVVCESPIKQWDKRLVFAVRLDPPIQRNGQYIDVERFQAHVFCILEADTPDVTRTRAGQACWDCGAGRTLESGRPGQQPFHCFTGSRFGHARICEACAERKRWSICEQCVVFYPRHMVRLRHVEYDDGVSEGTYQMDLCDNCAERIGARGVGEEQKEREQFEALRRRILERGLDG